MKSRHKYLLTIAYTALLTAMMSLALTSCTDEPASPVSPDGTAVPDCVWLSFDVTNMGDTPGTRADDDTDPGGHPAETATAEENYIDTGDITMMLFDDNDRLIKIVSKDDYSVEIDPSVADYKAYRLKAMVHRDYFDYTDADNVSVGILLVANLSGGTFTAPLFTSLSDVSNMLNSCTFSPSLAGSNTPWTPSVAQKRHIPMSGFKRFTFNRSDFISSTESSPTSLGTVSLQRALTKFRFIENFDPALGMEMRSVTIKGSNTRVAYMPVLSTNSRWPDNHCYLEAPSVSSGWYNSSVQCPTSRVATTSADGNRHYTFTAYGSEYTTSALPTVIFEAYDSSGNKYEYTINLADQSLNLNFGYIVRNHIYEFTVEADPKEPKRLHLEYTVCRWLTPADINIDFN